MMGFGRRDRAGVDEGGGKVPLSAACSHGRRRTMLGKCIRVKKGAILL